MKKYLLFSFAIFCCLNCFSQISYQQGYFIDNSGQKINCLIRNVDWKDNPTDFKYKRSEEEAPKVETIENVKEFGINDVSRYLRATVDIDRSSENFKEMSYERAAQFKEETLFLKQLVGGKANLFFYEDDNIRRFFFNVDSSNIQQLVSKSYLVSTFEIKKNNRYKQQLLNNLKCESISSKKIKNIEYTKQDLIKLFVAYNQCETGESTDFRSKEKRDMFNLNLRPGLNFVTLDVYTNRSQGSGFRDNEFKVENELNFRFGIEVEFILPFNKNKWAVLLEPTYQSFSAEQVLGSNIFSDQTVTVDYNSIDISTGLRHYFFINDKLKVFINVAHSFNLNDRDGLIDYERFSDFELEVKNNFIYGFGVNYNNKFSIEVRRNTNREILTKYPSWSGDYTSNALIFGYTIF